MCHVGRFYSAHRAALERGIKYLNHFKDDDWILLDPGPGDEAYAFCLPTWFPDPVLTFPMAPSCSRVSCSSYSGIYGMITSSTSKSKEARREEGAHRRFLQCLLGK